MSQIQITIDFGGRRRTIIDSDWFTDSGQLELRLLEAKLLHDPRLEVHKVFERVRRVLNQRYPETIRPQYSDPEMMAMVDQAIAEEDAEQPRS